MDVEGAEHGILNAMIGEGTLALIDVLILECHPRLSDSKCKLLLARVRRAAPELHLVTEGKGLDGFRGYDSHSQPPHTQSQMADLLRASVCKLSNMEL